MMNAAYLVDNAALLSLQEKQDGVEFHCFDMGSKVQIAEGHMGWDVLDKQSFSTFEESARVAALKEIPQLDGLTVAPVAPEMLEQVRGGRKVLWQMKKADSELEKFDIKGAVFHHVYQVTEQILRLDYKTQITERLFHNGFPILLVGPGLFIADAIILQQVNHILLGTVREVIIEDHAQDVILELICFHIATEGIGHGPELLAQLLLMLLNAVCVHIYLSY